LVRVLWVLCVRHHIRLLEIYWKKCKKSKTNVEMKLGVTHDQPVS
jgi:hypothetical protein